MATKKKCIRVVYFEDDKLITRTGLILEQFRYAGLITWHDRGSLILDPIKGYQMRYVFDVHCPHTHSNDVWANMNAERMRSFGLNAVVVPVGQEYRINAE